MISDRYYTNDYSPEYLGFNKKKFIANKSVFNKPLELQAFQDLKSVVGDKKTYKVINFRLSRNTERVYEMLHPDMVQSLILSGKNVIEYFLFPFIFDIISKDVITKAQKDKFIKQLDNDLKEAIKIAERNKTMDNFNYKRAINGIDFFKENYKDVIKNAQVKNETMAIVLDPNFTCLL